MDTLTASIDALAIFGGSGATGQTLIAHALDEGHPVRTLARRASSISSGSDRVAVVEGSLSNPDDVMATLQGCSAVICVFGPRSPYTDIFCEQATATIISAMQQLGMRRLVCQTGGMIGDYRGNRTLPFQWMTDVFNRKAPQVAADRAGQERAVRESGLDWTIVKPPRLTDGAARNRYTAGEDVRLGMLSSITRGDLARFLVGEALRPRFAGKAVFVRN